MASGVGSLEAAILAIPGVQLETGELLLQLALEGAALGRGHTLLHSVCTSFLVPMFYYSIDWRSVERNSRVRGRPPPADAPEAQSGVRASPPAGAPEAQSGVRASPPAGAPEARAPRHCHLTGAGFFGGSPCAPSSVSGIKTPKLPLLPLWEKGV
jgi:hypothetical protein